MVEETEKFVLLKQLDSSLCNSYGLFLIIALFVSELQSLCSGKQVKFKDFFNEFLGTKINFKEYVFLFP